LWGAESLEQIGGTPHLCKSAAELDIAGVKRFMDGEGTGVHVADRVDQTDHPASTT
jgi:hypothetical protein